MRRTPSVLRRLAALALAGGVLLSTVGAGVHDPDCPHHAAVPSAVDAGPVEGDGAPGHDGLPAPDAREGPGSHHGSHPAPGESGEEDCSCLGGLCALSALVDPPLPGQVGLTWPVLASSESTPPVPEERPAAGAPHLLPPSTGPPVSV